MNRDEPDPRWQPQARRERKYFCRECRCFGGAPLTPCETCGVARCDACPYESCPGCRRLGSLLAVLRGSGEIEIDPHDVEQLGPKKTLSFALDLGKARDVLVSPRSVAIRSLGDPRRHSYYASAGPFILQWLLGTLCLSSLAGPTVAYVPSRRPYMGIATRAQVAWLLPQRDGLEIRFREPPIGIAPFDPRPIPETGELALPAPWSAPPFLYVELLYVEHGRGIGCPHCGTSALRHRAVRDSGGAVVCATCGRSFVPEART